MYSSLTHLIKAQCKSLASLSSFPCPQVARVEAVAFMITGSTQFTPLCCCYQDATCSRTVLVAAFRTVPANRTVPAHRAVPVVATRTSHVTGQSLARTAVWQCGCHRLGEQSSIHFKNSHSCVYDDADTHSYAHTRAGRPAESCMLKKNADQLLSPRRSPYQN